MGGAGFSSTKRGPQRVAAWAKFHCSTTDRFLLLDPCLPCGRSGSKGKELSITEQGLGAIENLNA